MRPELALSFLLSISSVCCARELCFRFHDAHVFKKRDVKKEEREKKIRERKASRRDIFARARAGLTKDRKLIGIPDRSREMARRWSGEFFKFVYTRGCDGANVLYILGVKEREVMILTWVFLNSFLYMYK